MRACRTSRLPGGGNCASKRSAPVAGSSTASQRYVRLDDEGDRRRFHYTSPAFGFECELIYDEFGLVLDYPGIAVRVV